MTASSSLRRSPVQDCLEELDPEWMEIHKMKAALRFKPAGTDNRSRSDVFLCDLSCLPKMGLKGSQALAWLEQQGIAVPESVYAWHSLEGDGLVVRTDRHEVFLEDGPLNDRISRLESELRSYSTGSYLIIRRQDASFLLDGAEANAVMRETCGVDLSQPQAGVVMTRVAGVSCMILRLLATQKQTPAFRLWLDPSYGSYLWKALLEIVRDHGGDAVGLEAFYPSLAPVPPVRGDFT